MAKDNAKERRKYIRLMTSTIVQCERYAIPMDASQVAEQYMSKNVSAGGVLFESSQPYAIGDIVKIVMHLPGWEKYKPEFYKAASLTEAQPLMALGAVVRVELVKKGLYDIGVCLTGIDEGHQMALATYIDRQMKQR